MNIVTALNRKYIQYTTVMLMSAVLNNKEHIEAFLLHSELENSDLRMIRNIFEAYNITIHEIKIDRSMFSDRLPRNEQWSLETYYRLMLLELLPDHTEKVLYLDGDIVINKSLGSLYATEFDDADIIACDDKCGLNDIEHYGKKNRKMFKEAYEQGYRYFNAGVMLLNIKQMRKYYSFQTYLNAIEAWNYEMEAPDQDILNWVHWKKVKYTDCNLYNLFARVAHNAGINYEEVKHEVAIIHFAGEKPWANDGLHFDIEKLWWDYAAKTPFYKKLMMEFVETAMSDRTIEYHIKNLSESNKEKSEKLKSVMHQVERILNKRL